MIDDLGFDARAAVDADHAVFLLEAVPGIAVCSQTFRCRDRWAAFDLPRS
jgi:hypothetical protein